MNRILLVLSTATVIGVAPVYAADLPAKSAAPAYDATAPFSWNGFYFGANAGYGFGGDGNVKSVGHLGPNIANIATGARPGSVVLDRNGALGGGQIGYNWQTGSLVYGLETDFSFTDLKDSRDVVTGQINTGLAQRNTISNQIDYLGTVRGRLGYAFDRTLIYGTGGLAYGRTTSSFDMFAPNGVKQFTDKQSDTKVGYTIGAGVEYAINNNISFKTEYLYYNLGNEKLNVQNIPGTGVAGGYDSTFRNDGQLVRVGLNYRF